MAHDNQRIEAWTKCLLQKIFSNVSCSKTNFLFWSKSHWCLFLHSPIDNKTALVQAIAWCQTSDRPLPEPILTKMSDLMSYHIIMQCSNSHGQRPTSFQKDWQLIEDFLILSLSCFSSHSRTSNFFWLSLNSVELGHLESMVARNKWWYYYCDYWGACY